MLAHVDFKTIGLPGQPQPNVLDKPGGSVGPPPPPAPCVASPPTIYWRFNQASGSEPDTADMATLTPVNAPGSAPGIQVNSRTFNGTTQYFTTPDQGDTTPTDPTALTTIAGWLYLANKGAAGTFQTVVSKGNVPFPTFVNPGLDFAYDIIYDHDADTVKCRVYEPGGHTAVMSILPGLLLNTWYCFAFMWDNVNLYGAANGALVGSVPFGFLPNEAHGLHAPINVGATVNGGVPTSFWNGRLDAIGYWRGYIFTASDLTGYYNAGVGREWTGTDWSPVCPTVPVYTTSPYGVAGAVAWYKADLETFQDSALTTPATADAAPVGGWKDQTGTGNNLLQATVGARPSLKLAQQNGLPSIHFNGTSAQLQVNYTLNAPYHVFLVMKMNAWVNNGRILTGPPGSYALQMNISSPIIRVWNGTGLSTNNTDLPVGSWGIVQNLMNAGVSGHYKVNTIANMVVAAAAAAGGTTLGADSTPTAFSNIDIGELIVYNVALSDTDETTVRNALNARWAIF